MDKNYKRLKFTRMTAVFIVIAFLLLPLSGCKRKRSSEVESLIEESQITNSESKSIGESIQMSSIGEQTSEKESVTTFVVVFDTDGGSWVSQQAVKEGETALVPQSPTKDGFVFIGWYLREQKFDFNTPINANIVLTAKWMDLNQNQVFAVSFVTNCSQAIATQIVQINSFAICPEDPEKEGYVFKGWFLDGEEFDFLTPITENLVLVALWEESREGAFTVSFISETEELFVQNVEEGCCAEEPAHPQREGYTFLGWYLNGEPFDFGTVITSSLVLEAKWEEIKEVFKVVFDSQGGTLVQLQVINIGDCAKIPENPTKEGYVFSCWLLNGQEFDFSSPINGDIVLVALWQAKGSVTEILGEWVGEENTDYGVYEYFISLKSENDGAIRITVEKYYSTEYSIVEAYRIEDSIYIVYDFDGARRCLKLLILDDTLVCERGIYGGEVILNEKK